MLDQNSVDKDLGFLFHTLHHAFVLFHSIEHIDHH